MPRRHRAHREARRFRVLLSLLILLYTSPRRREARSDRHCETNVESRTLSSRPAHSISRNRRLRRRRSSRLDVASRRFFENAISLDGHVAAPRNAPTFCKMRERARKLTSESFLDSTRNEIRAATRALYHRKTREEGGKKRENTNDAMRKCASE